MRTHPTVLFVIEELGRNRIPGSILGRGILLHEQSVSLTTWICNIDNLKLHSFALHDELSLHLPLFHLKRTISGAAPNCYLHLRKKIYIFINLDTSLLPEIMET